MNRRGGGDMMGFEDFGCEGRMSRDKIGVASWCSGNRGSYGGKGFNGVKIHSH